MLVACTEYIWLGCKEEKPSDTSAFCVVFCHLWSSPAMREQQTAIDSRATDDEHKVSTSNCHLIYLRQVVSLGKRERTQLPTRLQHCAAKSLTPKRMLLEGCDQVSRVCYSQSGSNSSKWVQQGCSKTFSHKLSHQLYRRGRQFNKQQTLAACG